MKKIIALILCVVIFAGLSACGKEEVSRGEAPQLGQMRNICQLATMECYYHNVAKFTEEDAERFLWITKDKNFWVEYSGIVQIGIDASRVDITVDGDKVTVTVPPAQILDCKVDENSLNEDSFIIAEDSAKITAEDQTAAFREAQDKMRESAARDSLLLTTGQQRAVELLENYIQNVGASAHKTYEVEWIFLDNMEAQDQTEPDNTTEENP